MSGQAARWGMGRGLGRGVGALSAPPQERAHSPPAAATRPPNRPQAAIRGGGFASLRGLGGGGIPATRSGGAGSTTAGRSPRSRRVAAIVPPPPGGFGGIPPNRGQGRPRTGPPRCSGHRMAAFARGVPRPGRGRGAKQSHRPLASAVQTRSRPSNSRTKKATQTRSVSRERLLGRPAVRSGLATRQAPHNQSDGRPRSLYSNDAARLKAGAKPREDHAQAQPAPADGATRETRGPRPAEYARRRDRESNSAGVRKKTRSGHPMMGPIEGHQSDRQSVVSTLGPLAAATRDRRSHHNRS